MKKKEESYSSLLMLILSGILMLLIGGAAVTWVSYLHFVQKDEVALQHSTWTQVPAQVLQCRVLKASARYRNQRSHEWLQVRYSYHVNGVRYESDVVGNMDRERLDMFSEASHQSEIGGGVPANYLPPSLCCYVNPENPAEAKLFTDVEITPWWWIVIQLCLYGGLALMGGFSIVLNIKDLIRRVRGGADSSRAS